MPFIRIREIAKGTWIGLWKITESSAELKQKIRLDAADEMSFSGFGSETRKKQWLAVRIILAFLLGKTVKISYGPHGQPFLDGRPEMISVSHSRDFAALILSLNHPVGIDIERIRERIENVKERFLTPAELGWVGYGDRPEKLHVLWGAKESAYKLSGNPDLDMRSDIIVEPFDYLCNKEGTCMVRVNEAGTAKRILMIYEKIEDYLLVYTPQG